MINGPGTVHDQKKTGKLRNKSPFSRKMAGKKRSTMDYYKKHPEAYRKKIEYEAKRRKTDRERERYNERRRFRRANGLEGKMGDKDVSHTKSGRLVLENRSKNRSRNGEGGRRTLK